MADPVMNNLLRWGIENSESSHDPNAPNAPPESRTQLNPAALQAFFGGMKSDADHMKDSMNIIEDAGASNEQKEVAFEDLEMLIQGIDNANNMENLGLWSRLVDKFEHEEPSLRKWAAWCAGTAVENNPKAQERLLVIGAVPSLVKLATEDESVDVRKKAVRALSAVSRNYQPGLDALVDNVPSDFKPKDKLDAADMDSVDSLITPLREHAQQAR
ncbi:putative Hsp70 nucleotide exchange factor [Massarina eburnea CBS 473.64]|uniref:Putative Hsp70 nucleotide exchange factor n=1 Tax=Massarina eburnea CBS 473.64 TaxID=1395130 RepID=A0A6A6S0Z6_9PLEO|nr:putative Hsp70 nucleotide exchange factor [Massarina eburnea CBS 473.64]